MLMISNSDILEQHAAYMRAYSSGAAAPFLTSDYISSAFPRLEERANTERLKKMKKAYGDNIKSIYPYQVKIPKGIEELLQGDYEPARIFSVNGPIKGPYSNIWFGDTTEGVNVRWGYVNGDSRQISDQAFDDLTVHGFLGGATGKGKSVTLNALIYGCCMEYAPWELTLTLSDAKIVEFKSIAVNHPMPHIDMVAATDDTDYLLSLLEKKHRIMAQLNEIFPKASKVFGQEIKNIKDFRRVTGLCLPRNLLVFDECTAMFSNAGKRASKVAFLIDDIARLGRNVGMHLLLTSQEVSSDLPDKTLSNLSLRGAMGCTPSVSTKILGNDEAASNFNRKGRLLVNKDPAQGKKEDNVLVRVPFMPGEQVNKIADCVIARGKEFQINTVMRFFDSGAVIYTDEYREFLKQFEQRADRLILGPPSFIMDGAEQCVTYEMPMADSENICIIANGKQTKLRALTILCENIMQHAEVSHVVMCADRMFITDGGIDSIAHSRMSFEENDYNTSIFMEIARSTIYRRLLCIKADTSVFMDGTTTESVDKLFYQLFEKGSEFDTVTNRCRAKYYYGLLKTDAAMISGFQLENLKGEVLANKMNGIVSACIQMCKQFGCAQRQISALNMKRAYFWMFGMERVIGLGRDNRSKCVTALKKLMQDCTVANVRFIIFTSTMEDLNSLCSAIGLYLLEDVTDLQIRQIKAADYWPGSAGKGMMYAYKPNADGDFKMQKFKKVLLDGEMPV